jgi:hypothetical protein
MSFLEVIPAIDLLGGRCVRLSQGDYDRVSVYGEDPGAVAEGFVRIGAQRVHTVDLDGARAGTPHNRDAVRAIAAAAKGVPVQRGGGCARWRRSMRRSRSASSARSWAPPRCANPRWCARRRSAGPVASRWASTRAVGASPCRAGSKPATRPQSTSRAASKTPASPR